MTPSNMVSCSRHFSQFVIPLDYHAFHEINYFTNNSDVNLLSGNQWIKPLVDHELVSIRFDITFQVFYPEIFIGLPHQITSQRYWWPDMSTDVVNYFRSCLTCHFQEMLELKDEIQRQKLEEDS